MADDELTVLLTGSGADVHRVGGKGAWTDRMIAAGFRVPPTAVVTTEAYRAVAAVPGLAALLAEEAASPVPPPSEHEAARERLDDAFMSAELPAEVAAALDRGMEWIGGEGARVAVRSSATAEDLHGTSFAGQYRSVLDIEDRAGLERAVRLVWASLWHPAPRAYRRFHGVDERGLAMAVILMRQIDAVRAGVVFTVDPGGQPDSVRVETVVGAGEQLVSGRVTPSVVLVDRARPDSAEGLAAEVASLALDVEASFDSGPLDLEWAIDDAGLWLLQARPITTGVDRDRDDGFDTPDWQRHRWSTSGIVEMVPGVLPPLRYEVVALALEEALRAHEDRSGNLPEEAAGRPLLGRVRGRVVLDDELMDRMRARAAPRGRWRDLARSLSALRQRRRAMWEAGTVSVAAWEAWERMPDLARLPDDELWCLRWRLVDLAGRAMAAEVAVASAAVADETRLESLLRRHLDPDDARSWALEVTVRPDGTSAGWPAGAIARVLSDTPADVVAALAAAPDPEGAVAAVANLPEGPDSIARLRAPIGRAGSSAVLGGPTWEEQPAIWWPALRRAAEQERDRRTACDASDVTAEPAPSGSAGIDPTPLDDLLDGLAADPEWARARVRTLQIIDVRRLLIRRQAEQAADLLERRERTKAAVLGIGGLIRRVHLELGARLVAAEVLEEPGDVELLSAGEVQAWVDGRGDAVPSPAELARRRHWSTAAEDAGPLPERFEGALPQTAQPAAPVGDLLEGWGASPGHHRGRVQVVRHPAEADLHRGDVLVATSTDASWAPLFMSAGAVVVEEGGPLSHAAIVARELGIPAVVNLPGIVARLSEGVDEVTVDGDAGTVAVHQPEGERGHPAGADVEDGGTR